MARGADGREAIAMHGRRSVAEPAPMSADTIFWLASMTKLVTSIAALQLIEEGALGLDQPVADLRPDFADIPVLDGYGDDGKARLRPATDRPTIRHLITHTAGLGYAAMDPVLARYAEENKGDPALGHLLPRRFDAGAGWLYGASTDWLGAAIEVVSGKGLDAVFEERIFGPLGMTDMSFAPGPDQLSRKAQVHARLPDGSLVPTEFAMPTPPYFSMGGGGLYGTGPDYMKLLAALLDGQVLSPASRAGLFANAVGDLDAGCLVSSSPRFTNDFDPLPGHAKRWSLGLLHNPNPVPGRRAAASGAWAGLANTYFWVDPTTRVAGLLLTQILPFADPDALALFTTLEETVYA
jgi:CubicO group peptidase (beta-lactamase class C family)